MVSRAGLRAFALFVLPAFFGPLNPGFVAAGAAGLMSVPGDEHWWGGFGDETQLGLNGFVFAMAEHDSSLFVGGNFIRSPGWLIQSWKEREWSVPAGGYLQRGACQGIRDCGTMVNAITEYHGDLIAAGRFYYTGFLGSLRSANNVARWDGVEWRPLGSGARLASSYDGYIVSMTVYHDELIVSGPFDMAGGQPVNAIAAWNGSNWHPLGSGFDDHWWATSMLVYQDTLIVAGNSTRAGGVSVPHIAKWDGTSWSALGTQDVRGPVWVHEGSLVANVEFRGDVFSPMVCHWTGSAWQPL
ncbi:MAG TPA: hypothetical protein VIY86_01920, partial [Pirellulaceae bacterium]